MSMRSPGVSVMRETTLGDQGISGIFARNRNSVTIAFGSDPVDRAELVVHLAVALDVEHERQVLLSGRGEHSRWPVPSPCGREYSLTMATATAEPTREKLLDAAIELFSSKGYEATSVADIQLACGLTAGSGALYKHFPSKHALLNDGSPPAPRRRRGGTRCPCAGAALGLDPNGANLEAMLRLAAQAGVRVDGAKHAVVRITIRDLEPYPDLLESSGAASSTTCTSRRLR